MDDPNSRAESAHVPPAQDTAAVEGPRIDPQRVEEFFQDLRDQQHFSLAILAGALAALAGAAIWATVTAVTNYQIGWMAVGIGFLVGIAVRAAGKGIEKHFGYAGAALSLFGCVLGNVLVVYIIAAKAEEIPFLEVVSGLPVEDVFEIMKKTFSPMDLLFYGIAVYEGYRFSFRQVAPEEFAALAK